MRIGWVEGRLNRVDRAGPDIAEHDPKRRDEHGRSTRGSLSLGLHVPARVTAPAAAGIYMLIRIRDRFFVDKEGSARRLHQRRRRDMRKQILRRPSPAMVVAILALCLAVGGTAFAAVKLGKSAVKTKNIKDGAVTESKIAANAVTESKIANGAVSAGKLSGSAKSLWVQMDITGANISVQSG